MIVLFGTIRKARKMTRTLRRQFHNSKIIIFICIFLCAIVVWTKYDPLSNEVLKYHEKENYSLALTYLAIKNTSHLNEIRLPTNIYAKESQLPTTMKFILFWTWLRPYYWCDFGTGQAPFYSKKCAVKNCYLTREKYFFGGDVTKFHAIAFWGCSTFGSNLPRTRSPHQKYVYINTEPAAQYQHCEPYFDGFFNLTSTYRLDSDIPTPYFRIRNHAGEIVGPKIDMKWEEYINNDTDRFDKDITTILENRTKAAAWFVSRCSSLSKREDFVKNLSKALKVFRLNIDVYGECGPFKAPAKKWLELTLEKNYFFYMSLENAFDRDYVTEKVLFAFRHNMIPIVWGGADYSRFLPPNSYIDGRKTTPEKLASQMSNLINSPEEYKRFFKWKQYYSYDNNDNFCNLCALCERLNDKNESYSSHENFRDWWNVEKCEK